MNNYNLKSPLFIGLLLIATLIVGTFLTFPKYKEWSSLYKEVKNVQTEIQNQNNYFASLKKTNQELEKYQDQISKINAALPDDPLISTLGVFLNKKAFENGLVLKNMSVGTTIESQEFLAREQSNEEITNSTEDTSASSSTEDASNNQAKESRLVKETNVSVELIGLYPSFNNFISSVEKSARLIDVVKISIFPSQNEGGDILTFDIDLKIYSY